MCFKCQKPYFGGLKDCERAMDEDKREFKPSELVCANCCDIPVDNCVKHGTDFIEFKCRFCCSLAVWFCWLEKKNFIYKLSFYLLFEKFFFSIKDFLFNLLKLNLIENF